MVLGQLMLWCTVVYKPRQLNLIFIVMHIMVQIYILNHIVITGYKFFFENDTDLLQHGYYYSYSEFIGEDIGELDVSRNNLRSISSDVQRLKHLVRLDLSENGIRCTHPSDYSGLPAELVKLNNLKILNISENNMPYIPPSVWTLTKLEELDISRNKINVLLAEVGNLSSLKHLNAQQCNINSLPAEIAYCQNLETLKLYGNTIESLPETMRELPRLREFHVNYRCFNSIVDPYMETLMCSGQIPSEHIPQVQ